MTRLRLALLLSVSTIAAAMAHTAPRAGQGGDQFLDGIGETALIARYLFNGNAEDASRNQAHAMVSGAGAVFVDDATAGRQVLLLTGDGSHVRLPANVLAGEDALTVAGWLFVPTGASGPIFDFGRGPTTRLFAVVDARRFRVSTPASCSGALGACWPSTPGSTLKAC